MTIAEFVTETNRLLASQVAIDEKGILARNLLHQMVEYRRNMQVFKTDIDHYTLNGIQDALEGIVIQSLQERVLIDQSGSYPAI